ncbi:hypothetical protein [Paraburkholderia lycopersici]|uniref:Uncharacterized protein n=1 Tax=Paraburkholderia lycopersici TaxID=416944 RepID=A0A1G6Q214_9BURK|nr:hypothetical protein [Paraburkholderia lycopersici]SDC86403.1 hypothetical protein SAMN05421548_11158 [Paraburkholderia lycopersici]
MTVSDCRNRSLADMTVRELAHLRLLNERLLEIEQWIRECAARISGASIFVFSGVQLRYRFGAGNRGVENRFDVALATLEAGDRFGGASARRGKHRFAAPLSDVCPSPLFIELHRRLHGDWGAMLDVGHVHAALSISLRREFDKDH